MARNPTKTLAAPAIVVPEAEQREPKVIVVDAPIGHNSPPAYSATITDPTVLEAEFTKIGGEFKKASTQIEDTLFNRLAVLLADYITLKRQPYGDPESGEERPGMSPDYKMLRKFLLGAKGQPGALGYSREDRKFATLEAMAGHAVNAALLVVDGWRPLTLPNGDKYTGDGFQIAYFVKSSLAVPEADGTYPKEAKRKVCAPYNLLVPMQSGKVEKETLWSVNNNATLVPATFGQIAACIGEAFHGQKRTNSGAKARNTDPQSDGTVFGKVVEAVEKQEDKLTGENVMAILAMARMVVGNKVILANIANNEAQTNALFDLQSALSVIIGEDGEVHPEHATKYVAPKNENADETEEMSDAAAA